MFSVAFVSVSVHPSLTVHQSGAAWQLSCPPLPVSFFVTSCTTREREEREEREEGEREERGERERRDRGERERRERRERDRERREREREKRERREKREGGREKERRERGVLSTITFFPISITESLNNLIVRYKFSHY